MRSLDRAGSSGASTTSALQKRRQRRPAPAIVSSVSRLFTNPPLARQGSALIPTSALGLDPAAPRRSGFYRSRSGEGHQSKRCDAGAAAAGAGERRSTPRSGSSVQPVLSAQGGVSLTRSSRPLWASGPDAEVATVQVVNTGPLREPSRKRERTFPETVTRAVSAACWNFPLTLNCRSTKNRWPPSRCPSTSRKFLVR